MNNNIQKFEKLIRFIGLIAGCFLVALTMPIHEKITFKLLEESGVPRHYSEGITLIIIGFSALWLWVIRFKVGLFITVFLIKIIDSIKSVLTWCFKQI